MRVLLQRTARPDDVIEENVSSEANELIEKAVSTTC